MVPGGARAVQINRHNISVTSLTQPEPDQLTGYAGRPNSFSSCSMISKPFSAGLSILLTTCNKPSAFNNVMRFYLLQKHM